jgi:diaminopimelate epimerase
MRFTKMHGLGNDFILIELPQGDGAAYGQSSARLCDRHTGVGADGLVLVLPSTEADFRMRIFNADGSEPEMCGNAIRCFAKYAYERGLTDKADLTVETLAGIIKPRILTEDGHVTGVRVDMGAPGLDRVDIPMTGPTGHVINESFAVGGETLSISGLRMGVPHMIVWEEPLSVERMERLGKLMEVDPSFPQKTNVNFAEVLNRDEIAVRTWERGVGPTLACGTGCCATAVAASMAGFTERKATVHLALGNLFIEWAQDGHVYMTGPAVEVFTGSINI